MRDMAWLQWACNGVPVGGPRRAAMQRLQRTMAGRGTPHPPRARCGVVDTASGEQGPYAASPGGGQSRGAAAVASPVDGLGGPIDGLGGPVHGLSIFFVFSFRLTEMGQATASENKSFTVILGPRRLQKMHLLIGFARLG